MGYPWTLVTLGKTRDLHQGGRLSRGPHHSLCFGEVRQVCQQVGAIEEPGGSRGYPWEASVPSEMTLPSWCLRNG